MANEKYPDRSISGSNQPEKPQPVVNKEDLVEKKENKLKRAFISEDIVDVKDYVFMDVFVPALKKLIVDIFYNGLNALFYGNKAPRTYGGGSRVNMLQYDKMSQGYGNNYIQASQVRSPYEYSTIKFKEKEKAEYVLAVLDEILDRFGEVTVADLYQQIKKSPSSIDWNWGWKDLRNASVMYSDNGWIIDLPKVVSINKRR